MKKASLLGPATVGLALGLSLFLSGCGGGKATVSSSESGDSASQSDIVITASQQGASPFIAFVQLVGQNVFQLSSVQFTITPKTGTVSAPVSVTWSAAALRTRGDFQGQAVNVPVFGLYQNYQNQVTFQLTFNDGSTQQLQTDITTETYGDPTGVYLNPTILKARSAGSSLGYSFFVMKSLIASPIVVDTDGEVRWEVPVSAPTFAVYYGNGQFTTGSEVAPTVTTLGLDGKQATPSAGLPQPLLASFTHNIDPGPAGLLAEFNGTDDLGDSYDDIVAEMTPSTGQPPAHVWDMADIISSYMLKNGDDASAFVRPGADWFHLNASTYDPSDNSVIVSSREDFLIKVDYDTGNIIWILGDPTKYWYTFPSLRAKALTLDSPNDYPVGQHAVSITSDGSIMVFNDGFGSGAGDQPAGAPLGITRTYSEVSTYTVNTQAMTAHLAWKFDYGQTVFSPVCGSSYEAPGGGYLVDFATADDYQQARLVGLDSNQNVVFDFQYNSPQYCSAAWNAIPIPFESMQIN